MYNFLIKTLIACSLTGAWCAVTLSEIGPTFSKEKKADVDRQNDGTWPSPPQASERPKGSFGSGSPDAIKGP